MDTGEDHLFIDIFGRMWSRLMDSHCDHVYVIASAGATRIKA